MAGYLDNLNQHLPVMDGTTLTRPPTAADIAQRTAAAAQLPGLPAAPSLAQSRLFGFGPKLGDIPVFGRSANNGYGATPAATQNAVVGANNAAGGSLDMSADVGVSGRSGFPAAQPNGVTDLGNGIVRRGNTYSNLGVAGLDDIDNKRGTTLPSVDRVLAGIQPGDLNPPQAQAAPTTQVARGAHADQIAALDAEAAPYLSSRGLGANYHGRVLARQARTLQLADVQQQNAQANTTSANAHALTAENEFPLASMRDVTTQRGQNFGLAEHLPTLQIQNAALARLHAGDLEGAKSLLTLSSPRTGFQPHGLTLHSNPVTGEPMGTFDPNSGVYTALPTLEDQKRRAASDAALAARP